MEIRSKILTRFCLQDSNGFGMGKRGEEKEAQAKINRGIRQSSTPIYNDANMVNFRSITKLGKLLIADL